ncbi:MULTISPECIES: hypothetical protein [unclassified Tolypothrix]|uniref:hypothetical protein n=1 Tax=unclassified Tolypothrix TaxID=2649714 RepID=UPI0005EAA3E7|nr:MULTISPECIES: hypothetical protein [unclassified Tolypothrix]BAY88040.1 thymidylate kinase [Microchaete diplosiphon NIES-3275]EKF00553.1 putative dTMP kinase [Tolypothrix sp. PCC 7601]MBE9083630.1 hypothetical protein [Tolypothrix sp. LEGE 11397]UYD28756.1 hypothetical protein HGR01_12390 [Tolypothrix sp. PCC 7712]UYD35333.1 hypothetical protein HG267_05970 [Tolypothrix sp. PCC 7601]
MPALQVVQILNNYLDQKNIRYCHWKSNEHVDAAVEGKTDLDVLVDENEKENLKQVLSEVGFKYFEAIPCRRYVDIDDYLAIDRETGILVHLHLHYRLELGEKHLKGYRLPWEELLLSTRIYDNENQIYIAEPNIETIILIVRAVLKVRTRDSFKAMLGKDYFKGDFIREFRWLKERIDLSKIQQLSEELLGSKAAKLVLDVINSESNLKLLLKSGNPIYSSLQKYRYSNPLFSRFLRWQREFKSLYYKSMRKFFQAPVPAHRTPTNGGIIIAVLGADGSGKSTVTGEITKCFSHKLDVLPVYLGSGDGPASLIRLPLVWASKVGQVLRSKKSRNQSNHAHKSSSSSGSSKRKSKFSILGKVLWAITLVYEKLQKLQQSRTARDRGMMVISDRYPQTQILGFNDGPLLSSSNQEASPYPAVLQKWELQRYQYMVNTMPPDLVIKLHVTPEIALARKSDTPPEIAKQKVEAVHKFKFPPQTMVVNIDATQPLDQVLLQAKLAVWDNL